jgi:hypothetical protein
MTDTPAPTPSPKPLVWTPHPLLPVPTPDIIQHWLAQPGGEAKLAGYYTQRETFIRLSEQNPFAYGAEPDHWKDADSLLQLDILIMMIFGGNRAGKSEYAAKRTVADAVNFPDSVVFCLHENEKASVALQQKYVWRYLPPEIQALQGRSHAVYKVKYSQANGFTDGKMVLPNRSEIYFLTYGQKPGDFEGLELGAKGAAGRVGVWADENMTLPWLNMLKLRLASRSAKLVWTYTPVNGITPTIKELLGTTAKTIKSLYAELLPDRVNVPGLPVGHMPYMVEPYFEKARAIYFHSILNPFGAHYVNIKALCQGKPSEYIERRAYGFSRDVAERRFPYFGAWNVIKRDALPATGTNYMFTDPAGGRNWATIWIRVAPGNPPRYYVYRDWPPEQKYGEWAVPTEREITSETRRGWDGDPGPAQRSLGYGIVQYKQLFLREETFEARVVGGQVMESDPFRRRMVEERAREDGLTVTLSGTELAGGASPGGALALFIDSVPALSLDGVAVNTPTTWTATLQEPIMHRYIDSRAGRNQMTAQKGGTCLVDEMLRVQLKPGTDEVAGPLMRFQPASGVDIEEGITAINGLLFFNPEEPILPLLNEPRLYVTEDCRQFIWAMQNFTGHGGESGACKDFVDVCRYMALARLRHIDGRMLETTGGGTY